MADAAPNGAARAVKEKHWLRRPLLGEDGAQRHGILGVELRDEHDRVALAAAPGVHLDVHRAGDH
eukprot:210994-Prymnesium_polylepis.1